MIWETPQRRFIGSVLLTVILGFVAMAKAHPQRTIRIMAPLDETRDEREKFAALNVERLFR